LGGELLGHHRGESVAVTLSTFFAPCELAYTLRHADAAILLTAAGYLQHAYCARLQEPLPDCPPATGASR